MISPLQVPPFSPHFSSSLEMTDDNWRDLTRFNEIWWEMTSFDEKWRGMTRFNKLLLFQLQFFEFIYFFSRFWDWSFQWPSTARSETKAKEHLLKNVWFLVQEELLKATFIWFDIRKFNDLKGYGWTIYQLVVIYQQYYLDWMINMISLLPYWFEYL